MNEGFRILGIVIVLFSSLCALLLAFAYIMDLMKSRFNLLSCFVEYIKHRKEFKKYLKRTGSKIDLKKLEID